MSFALGSRHRTRANHPLDVTASPFTRKSSLSRHGKDSIMNRRDISKLLGAVAAVTAVAPSRAPHAGAQSATATPSATATVGMLVFPGMTALDLIGPQQFFAVMPGHTTQLLWKTREPVISESGVPDPAHRHV